MIQQSKFGSIVSGPLPQAIPEQSRNADSQEIHTIPTSATQYHAGIDAITTYTMDTRDQPY